MSANNVDEVLVEEVDFIESGEPVSHAKRRMDTNETRSLLVVEDERPVGLIQRNALLNVDHDDLEKPVSEFMNREFPKVTRGETLEQVHQRVEHDINIEQIPVVSESGQLVGAIDRHLLMERAEPAGGVPTQEVPESARAPVNAGMDVKDSTGSKLGTVAEAEFKSDGGVEFFNVEHGLIFKKQKRLPGDLIREIKGEEVHLVLDSTEFGMMRDIGDEEP